MRQEQYFEILAGLPTVLFFVVPLSGFVRVQVPVRQTRTRHYRRKRGPNTKAQGYPGDAP